LVIVSVEMVVVRNFGLEEFVLVVARFEVI
jgi:hypothetical protein